MSRSTYSEDLLPKVRKLAKLACTDAQMAAALDIGLRTFHAWKRKYPEFREELIECKDYANGKVKRSLYERATGYSHKEEKIFREKGETIRVEVDKHVSPDVTAQIFWLKNRDPEAWKDVKERIEHRPDDGQEVNMTELARRVAFLITGGLEEQDQSPPKTQQH